MSNYYPQRSIFNIFDDLLAPRPQRRNLYRIPEENVYPLESLKKTLIKEFLHDHTSDGSTDDNLCLCIDVPGKITEQDVDINISDDHKSITVNVSGTNDLGHKISLQRYHQTNNTIDVNNVTAQFDKKTNQIIIVAPFILEDNHDEALEESDLVDLPVGISGSDTTCCSDDCDKCDDCNDCDNCDDCDNQQCNNQEQSQKEENNEE